MRVSSAERSLSRGSMRRFSKTLTKLTCSARGRLMRATGRMCCPKAWKFGRASTSGASTLTSATVHTGRSFLCGCWETSISLKREGIARPTAQRSICRGAFRFRRNSSGTSARTRSRSSNICINIGLTTERSSSSLICTRQPISHSSKSRVAARCSLRRCTTSSQLIFQSINMRRGARIR